MTKQSCKNNCLLVREQLSLTANFLKWAVVQCTDVPDPDEINCRARELYIMLLILSRKQGMRITNVQVELFQAARSQAEKAGVMLVLFWAGCL